jgi:hypothetical protein
VLAAAKGMMSRLLSGLFTHDFTVFDGNHHVQGRPAEMLADGDPVIGYCRNFHNLYSFTLLLVRI